MHTHTSRLMLVCLALVACGPDQTSGGAGGDGDAIGNAASGAYDFESLTTSCTGTCAHELGGFTVSICDVGTRLTSTATVTQTDGHLRVDSDDSDYFSRMDGGIDADGSYDVSGVRTLEGGNFSVSLHVTGSFSALDGETEVTGTARGHITSVSSDGNFDCNLVAEVTATRL